MNYRSNTRSHKKGIGKPQDSISMQQYEHGWELISTMHTAQEVINATGLTRPQCVWLTKVGSSTMESYNKRMTKQVAAIRKRALDAAEQVGTDSLECLKNAGTITKNVQSVVKNLVAAYMIHLQQKIEVMQQASPKAKVNINDLAMPEGIRATLKVLKPYTDFSETARAFRIVFDSPHQEQNALTKLPKEAKVDLSAEGSLPAIVSLVEDLGGSDVGHDILDELLPEFKGWTEEDIDLYLETGERPKTDFGAQVVPLPLPANESKD